MKVLISIGHGKSKSGGYDSGAVGGGYHEFKLAREIGKCIKNALASYDCTATVINYDGDMYLTDRINYANKNSYDLALEIHLNAGGGTGSEAYYKRGNAQGKKLAGAISKNIANTFGIRDRGAKTKVSGGVDYFGFVREIKCQSLLIETVFIDTKSDRDKVTTVEGQKKCGQAIANAIISTYGIKKKTTSQSNTQTSSSSSSTVATAKFHTGDKVKIIGKYYATGQSIPLWVRLRTHTIKSVSGAKALLKEINSYVLIKDLKLVSSKEISVGDTVTIKKGAVYGGLSSTRGKAVPAAQLSPKKHNVSKIQTNKGVKEALLSDISSWVAVSSLIKA